MRLISSFVPGAMAALGLVSGAALAAPITFALPGDYDNTANVVNAGPTPVNNQTTGKFRDIFWWSLNNGAPRVGSPDFINRGNSLILQGNSATPGAGPHTALNFTGPSVSGGQGYLSIYDTTPADGTATKNLFDASQSQGGLVVSADVLFVKHNASGGVVALYNEGQDGLALLAHNSAGNNLDNTKVTLIFQSPGQGTQVIASANLPANTFIASEDDAVNGNSTTEHWYRVTMNLTVNGDAYNVNGTFQNHVVPGDPNSALAGFIPNSTLNFAGSLSNPGNAFDLTNPGEIGIAAFGNESISLPDNVGISVTNFEFPEPGALSLLAVGGLGFLRRRRIV